MSSKTKKKDLVAQNPLLLRCQRLMEAFAKSDDERDFYLDRMEGFLVFVDLDKSEEELTSLFEALDEEVERYCMIPKPTFFETKKIMEGFVHEKVYDIDTKEKLLDLIQGKDAREHFLDFLYDQHQELEKWQQYYQERSRIRIIEWLRDQKFEFVFEEDLELTKVLLEKIKTHLFDTKPPKEVEAARKMILGKSKTYYSNEALNPRPKRGRPPKQVQKSEFEPQFSVDIFTTVPAGARPFLFLPDVTTQSAAIFSAKYGSEEDLLASRRQHSSTEAHQVIENLNQRLATLRHLSDKWLGDDKEVVADLSLGDEDEEDEEVDEDEINFDLDDEEDEDDDDEDGTSPKRSNKGKASKKPAAKKPAPKAKAPVKAPAKKSTAPQKVVKKAPAKKSISKPTKKAPAKKR
jgi:hypothetical protein